MEVKRRPARLVKPGDILREELEERGWTQSDFAGILGKPYQAVSEIINGKKEITPDTALRIADALGTSPELWLNLESSYRLGLAKEAQTDSPVSRRATLYNAVPLKELVKNGWIEYKENVDELEQQIISFLGIENLGQMKQVAVRFRASQVRSPRPESLVCWLRRAEILASAASAKSYASDNLAKGVSRLTTFSRSVGQRELVMRHLAELGVRLVIVPHLEKTYVDGAAFWLGKESPVVALSMRFDRADNFWFTLMHELAHILMHSAYGTKSFVDVELEKASTDQYENQANNQARDWLIPPDAYEQFLSRCRGRFSKQHVLDFAYELGISPGIVVGRLHFDGHVPYKNMRPLIPKASMYL